MNPPRIVMTLSRLEARHLADLVAQFSELLEQTVLDTDTDVAARAAAADPALARLAPDPYPDDPDASADFRSATTADLFERRQNDALRVLADLAPAFAAADGSEPSSLADDSDLSISLDADTGWAWMRTLTAIRLVIATRLGIEDDERGRDPDDDRHAVYDWVGYRLDGIVQALSA
jgi:hypothetical protein